MCFYLEVCEVQADRITYAAAMLACEETAAWRCSFALLSMMYEATMPGLRAVCPMAGQHFSPLRKT